MQTTDISIHGSGFYQLTADTAKGTRFMRRVQGFSDGVAHCDDTRLTEDIAAGALRSGLRVMVNGRSVMLGKNADVVVMTAEQRKAGR